MDQKPHTKPILAFILAFAGVVFFSSKSVLVKMAYHYQIDALSLVTLRLLFSVPIYATILLLNFRHLKNKKSKYPDYLKLIFLGIIGYYLASILDFMGLRYVSASLERLILFVYPTMVLIISAIFLGKKATIEQKLAVFITYFGVIMAFYQNEYTSGKGLMTGGALIFTSALSYAVYLVGTGSIISKFGTVLFTSMVMLVSATSAGIHFSLTSTVDLLSFPKQVYYIALTMSVVSTVIPSFLLSEAIRQWGPSNVAIVGSFGPISTIILAGIFLGERVTIFQMLGTVIVISGVLLLAINKKTKVQPQVRNLKANELKK